MVNSKLIRPYKSYASGYPWLPDILGVVIGVQQTMLTVSEGKPVLVCVNLTQGTLARDAVVKLTTMNGNAIGNTLYMYNIHLLTRLQINCVLITDVLMRH